MRHVAIVGGGPAGLAAALWARRLGIHAVIFERRSGVGGQLSTYSMPVVDLPGFPTGPASALTEQLSTAVERVDVPIETGREAVSWDGTHLRFRDGTHTTVDWLFYAPGLRSRRLGISGEDLAYSGSMSDLASQPGHRKVLVVGAGDRAVEGAIRLAQAGHDVTVLSRSRNLRARLPYQQQLSETRAVVWREVEADTIEGVAEGRLRARLKGAGTSAASGWEGSEIVVRIGMEPDVLPNIATVRGDQAYARALRMTIVGDAALDPWERSLATVFASSMRAVKAYVQGMNR